MPVAFKLRVIIFITIIAVVVGLDQWSKIWVLANLTDQVREIIPGFFSLVLVRNSGLIFGLPFVYAPIIVLAAIIVLLVLVGRFYWTRIFHGRSPYIMIAVALIIGGAAGNLVDRLNYGAVIDYLSFYIWPVFNLADAAVVVGTLMILGYLIWRDYLRPHNKIPSTKLQNTNTEN